MEKVKQAMKAVGVGSEGGDTVYCSLDIETTGFDPQTEEILEVGMVRFRIKNSKLQILEEWEQVFKPTKEVSPKIFGLTGIKPEELVNAPGFDAYKSVIQEKVKDAVVVGHNIVFDIKFLETKGINFSGQTIDTLDLVQWLLPTHHSYNLENLMHYFGIRHENAHRALADAKAALEILQKFFGVYQAFGKKLKEQIEDLLKNQDLAWKPFLELASDPGKENLTKAKKASKAKTFAKSQIKIIDNAVYNFPVGSELSGEMLGALLSSEGKYLLVVPKVQDVLSLWKDAKIKPLFSPDQVFDPKKFKELLKGALSADEVKFCLKLLVWQYTNWQNQAILDLNLSFFGGQFKEKICGGILKPDSKAKILACDLQTFFGLDLGKQLQKRKLVVLGLAQFESGVSAGLSEKVSWGGVSYGLKTIYNPEIGSGDVGYKKEVAELLTSSDLFFGLCHALLQGDPPGFVDVVITPDFINSEKYNKIRAAAENFVSKVSETNRVLQSAYLERSIKNLENFFVEEPNRVKWIELSENRCQFNNAPLLVGESSRKIVNNFESAIFVDTLAPQSVTKFFCERLGIMDFKTITVSRKELSPKQRDLFENSKPVRFELSSASLIEEEIVKLVSKASLPAAMLFASPKPLAEFYERNYSTLKSYATLLAQNGSGGSGKLLNNFSINQNGLLLATDRFILKAINGNPASSRPSSLKVKTLVILRLPFEPVNHPYNQALAKTYPNAFESMALPKALYNLHQIVSFFYTHALEKVYLIDPKLEKGYAKDFYEYAACLSS